MFGWSTSSRPPGRSTVRISPSVARKVAVSGRCSKKLLQKTTSIESAATCADELVAGREHFFGAGRQRAAGQAFDVHGNAAAAADVAQELAEAGAQIEHGVVSADVALEEVPAQHLPDGVLGGAIGLGKARRVQRIETQRWLRTFAMRRLS